MKTHVSVIAGLLLAMGTSLAGAQDAVVVPDSNTTTVISPNTTSSTTVIAPEQEKVIRQYVKKEPLASINILGLDLSIGSKIPDNVELHQINEPDVQYRYTVVNDQTVLVDPQTREIVQVIR